VRCAGCAIVTPAMAGEKVTRHVSSDGAMSLSAGDCTFVYRRSRPGVLVVAISGHDNGQFGTATLDEIAAALHREPPLELFVDAREAVGVATSVSDDWTRFFSTHRRDLARVHVLVGSKTVHLTVAIAQHLSRTGSLIQIYSDPEIYESRLALAGRGAPR
jgi:hypothetical protein